MAYVSHSQHRAYLNAHRIPSPALVVRCAFVAVGAAAVVLALSGVTSVAERSVAMKSDRLSGPATASSESGALLTTAAAGGVEIMKDGQGRVVYLNDPAARTTTVARGASIPLTPESPLGHAAK